MANPTDKYDPANPGTGPSATKDTTQTNPGSFNFVDADGKVIKSVDIDSNRQARFTKIVTADDMGRNTIGAQYTGDALFAAGALTAFTKNYGGSTAGKETAVTQIVAGPGIYISAPNGKGVVTISTRPIDNQIRDDDLRQIVWTQTNPDNIPNGVDNSMFIAVGVPGAALRSRDGENFVETGLRNLTGVGGGAAGIGNVVCLQSGEFPDDGIVYFSINAVSYQDGAPEIDAWNTIWGRQGRANDDGIMRGDGMSTPGSHVFDSSSAEITTYQPTVLVCFHKTGDFADALFLVGDSNGRIWRSTNGVPCDFYDVDRSEGTANNPVLEEEINTTGEIMQIASNLEDHSWTNYRAVAITSNGRILYSNRNAATAGTWSTAASGLSGLYALVYGDGVGVAAGDNDSIWTSTNGTSWTQRTGVWAGTNWNWAAYGNGKFVIVGTQGHIVYSTDNGITWTRAKSGTVNELKSIAYSPTLNKFVAVGAHRTIITVKG